MGRYHQMSQLRLLLLLFELLLLASGHELVSISNAASMSAIHFAENRQWICLKHTDAAVLRPPISDLSLEAHLMHILFDLVPAMADPVLAHFLVNPIVIHARLC